MALFEVRNNSRSETLKQAKKLSSTSKKPSKTKTTALEEINRKVTEALGQYKDNYDYLLDRESLIKYIDVILEEGIVSIDTETSGLDYFNDKLVGISLYNPSNIKAVYIPLNHISPYTKEKVPDQLPEQFVKEQMKRLVDANVKTIWQNAKFDIQFFKVKMGLNFKPHWDTMIASHLLNENEPHGLKYLYNKYISGNLDEVFKYSELFEKTNFSEIPINVGYLYAAHDPFMTFKLFEFQRDFLGGKLMEEYGLEGVTSLFQTIEMPLIEVISEMEIRGIKIDKEYALNLSDSYKQELLVKQKEYQNELLKYSTKINTYSKKHPGILENPINYASSKQLSILLYDILEVGVIDKRKPRGTGEEILTKLDLPICKIILECRGYEKLIGTYIDKLPTVANDKTGAIHASFNQVGTDTGRFSSSDPNLQNIPAQDKKIRKMFVARDNHYLISSDFSQQEPRILAFLSGDTNLIDAYHQGRDVYAWAASIAFHKKYEECLEFDSNGKLQPEGKKRRSTMKAIVLGIMYSKGAEAIAKDLNISKEEANNIFDSFFKSFPKVKQFINKTQKKASNYGFVETVWGRKRRLPDMQLDKFEISVEEGYVKEFDPLTFEVNISKELDSKTRKKWEDRLNKAWGREKVEIIAQAKQEGINIKDNSMKVADAQRQCVNSVIQGSAADMIKLALVRVGKDEILRKLGFNLLLTVHDEIIGEAPVEVAKEAANRLVQLMIEAAADKVTVPMKCDATITKEWTGDEITI